MMTSVDIAEFVKARLDDTQLFAEAALEGWPDEFAGDIPREQAFAMHILADVSAKRAIVERYQRGKAGDLPEWTAGRELIVAGLAILEGVLRDFAAADAHHPDYQTEWSLDGT